MRSTTPRVYVAAPYADAAFVREGIHPPLRARGLACTSTWAETARGAEDFSAMAPEALRSAAVGNDRDVVASDVVLLLAREGAGGECFAEARLALAMRIPVVWHGRRTLSAWRDGVHLVDSGADYTAALELVDYVAHQATADPSRWTIRRAAGELHAQLGWALEELARQPGHRGYETRARALQFALEGLGLLDHRTLAGAREHARGRLAARGPASVRAIPVEAPVPSSPAPEADVARLRAVPRIEQVAELDTEDLRAHLRTALGVIRDFLRTSGRGAATLAEIEREVDL